MGIEDFQAELKSQKVANVEMENIYSSHIARMNKNYLSVTSRHFNISNGLLLYQGRQFTKVILYFV